MRNVFLPSLPVANWEIVEVPVTANGLTRVAIPDQPMLKSWAGKTVILNIPNDHSAATVRIDGEII